MNLMLPVLGPFSVLELGILATNVLLLLFARPIFVTLGHSQFDDKPVRRAMMVFRAINVAIILSIVLYRFLLPISVGSLVIKLVGILILYYLSYLGFFITNYFLRLRFGRVYEIDGKQVVSDTYNTRALAVLTAILFVIIALIATVQVLGFESLLKAGGVIGFVGVMLALTQASWAPDIISGLIVLNSKLVEEGDVIALRCDGEAMVATVYKTKMFHTEILNVVNNHRVMIRNSRLRDLTIQNLSKFASAKGLREVLSFNIGYEHSPAEVRAMFDDVLRACEESGIESQHGIDVRMQEAGDYAVSWRLFYYTKNVRDLLPLRNQVTEKVLEAAAEHNISLSTPMLHVAESRSLGAPSPSAAE